MAIRYDKKLNQEINKVIKNYNAKIRRIEKYDDSYNYLLPNKITKSDLKTMAYTRRELRRKLNELKRFSQRGIEQSIQLKGGYVLSRYEYENLKREKARVQRNITNELKRLELTSPTVYGKRQAFSFAKMGDSRYLNFLAKKEKIETKWEYLEQEEFERYEEFVYKAGRSLEYETSLFRENYKKMLFDLGYYTKYDNDKLKDLENKLDKLSNKQFYKLFNEEKSIKAITEYYVLTTGKNMTRIDPSTIQPDVWQNYDNLIENIDNIIANL